MSKKDKQVNVTLSGNDLEIFDRIKTELRRQFWHGPDAEILRMCLRFYGSYQKVITLLEELNINPLAPIEQIRTELQREPE